MAIRSQQSLEPSAPPPPPRRVGGVLLLLAAALFTGLSIAQDSPRVSEQSVKAAFLYKFAGYVQWPNDGRVDRSINIGVVATNEFARTLGEITADRLVSDRPISIRRLDGDDSVDGLDILFIGGGQGDRSRDFLAAAQLQPILTVTESASGLADGSIINFTLDQDRVRFEVSLYAAERSQLKLNARLLAVAQTVHRDPE